MIGGERLERGLRWPAVEGQLRAASGKLLQLVPALLLLVLIVLPLVLLLRYLGDDADGIWPHLVETVLWEYVLNSLLLVLGVGLGTLTVGAGAAWLVTMYRFPGRDVFLWALFLPLAMPAYVLAYAYTDLLDVAGPVQTALRTLWDAEGPVRDLFQIRSLPGAIFVLSLALYPYVYALARAAFVEQSQCALEVSRTLGCTGWGAFQRVGLPLARPAIVAGLSFVVMETLADFGAVSFFGVPTLTTGIYRAWYGLASPAAAAQLSALLLGFVLLVVVLERRLRQGARFSVETTHLYHKHLPRLRGLPALAATLSLGLVVTLGFALPAVVLIGMIPDGIETVSLDRLATLARHTLQLGAGTAVLLVAVAMLVAFAAHGPGNGAARALARAATLGYAVPGAVIGVAILLAVGTFDQLLGRLFGLEGLVIGGTLLAVVYGYLVRFFAVAYHPLEAGLARVNLRLEDAARTLGHGRLATFLRIDLPLLRPALLSALLLVLVDVMKELPATLILRPFNFDTLAIEAYRLATTERLDGAALPSLLIVLAGLVPVVLICRMTEGRILRSARRAPQPA